MTSQESQRDAAKRVALAMRRIARDTMLGRDRLESEANIDLLADNLLELLKPIPPLVFYNPGEAEKIRGSRPDFMILDDAGPTSPETEAISEKLAASGVELRETESVALAKDIAAWLESLQAILSPTHRFKMMPFHIDAMARFILDNLEGKIKS